MQGAAQFLEERFKFRSSTETDLTFDDVFYRIVKFIKDDPNSLYRISIGSDSQVKKGTTFITVIHIHRVGKGAIGFLWKEEIARPIKSLREKIFLETSRTLELAYMFTPEKINKIYSAASSKRRKCIELEFHIDIGTNGATKTLINEMVGIAKATIFVPKIKPDSYAASSYANKYTK